MLKNYLVTKAGASHSSTSWILLLLFFCGKLLARFQVWNCFISWTLWNEIMWFQGLLLPLSLWRGSNVNFEATYGKQNCNALLFVFVFTCLKATEWIFQVIYTKPLRYNVCCCTNLLLYSLYFYSFNLFSTFTGSRHSKLYHQLGQWSCHVCFAELLPAWEDSIWHSWS